MARGINSERDDDAYDNDTHTIQGCTATAETEKALLVKGTDDTDPEAAVWVPKSQIHDDSDVYENEHRGKLIVRKWFAKKQGWCDE